MLSKEEIEKAKKECIIFIRSIRTDLRDEESEDNFILADALETLLQYIQELEESNKNLDHENNRLEKIEFERDIANKVIDEMAKEINAKVLTKEQWCPLLSKENGCYEDNTCLKCLKRYFEKKVKEKL